MSKGQKGNTTYIINFTIKKLIFGGDNKYN